MRKEFLGLDSKGILRLHCGNEAFVPGADVGRRLELRAEAAGQRAGPLTSSSPRECQGFQAGTMCNQILVLEKFTLVA